MTRIESLKVVRKFVDEELQTLGVHTPTPLPPRPAPPAGPVPLPVPPAERPVISSNESRLGLTLQLVASILGQTGPQRDLPTHCASVMAELGQPFLGDLTVKHTEVLSLTTDEAWLDAAARLVARILRQPAGQSVFELPTRAETVMSQLTTLRKG
jgi:hypothetical protein